MTPRRTTRTTRRPTRRALLAQAERARLRGDTDLYDALCGLAAKAG